MRIAGAAVFVAAAGIITTVSFADGGYFRRDWLWLTLALCFLGGIPLLLREQIVLGRLELVTVGGLAGLLGWTTVSATWSATPVRSLHDAQRDLIYVAALLAFLLLVEPSSVRALLAGVGFAVAIVSVYSLGDRLFFTHSIIRDPVSGTRLDVPLGYANALGIVAAFGLVLAVGLLVHARYRFEQVLWAAAPIVFASALALTQSRGAVLALAFGIAVFVLLEPKRAELSAAILLLAVPCAASVLVTLRTSALTDSNATPSDLMSAGRRLAVVLVALAFVSAIACRFQDRLAHSFERRTLTWLVPVVLTVGLALVVTVVALGVDRALGPRVDYWRVAWHEFTGHPLAGTGAATFVRYWQRTGAPIAVLDAHSLYLETLAELGIVGLVFVVCALLPPLVVPTRGRAQPLTALATGVYAAFLVHAGFDWDWEMPAATLPGILGAVALLASGRPERPTFELSGLARLGVALVLVANALAALLARLLAA